MATAIVLKQDFLDLRDGTALVYTHVQLLSSSDTVTLPALADTTSGASVKQLKATSSETTVTVTSSGNVATLAGGSSGDKVRIASMTRQINSDVRS